MSALAKRPGFPLNYEEARFALEKCEQVDECKEWKDKSKALETYYRQVGDESLEKAAARIKGRAVRQAALLAKKVQARGKNKGGEKGRFTDGPGTGSNGAKAALVGAGFSKKQAVQALQTGNIPEKEFEDAIESENPPSLEQLAKMGSRRPKVVVVDYTGGKDPKAFSTAIQAHEAIEEFLEESVGFKPSIVAKGIPDDTRARLIGNCRKLSKWIGEIVEALEEK